MAIIKHIKSRNANYSDALNYLLYQHDEKSGKPVLDEYGNRLLREEFYMDGLNCSPLSFDKDCRMTNKKFNKNQKREDIKSHHYIISFDPADAAECGLTGNRAQELCLEFARRNFPGYQALVVTHTDGGNQSGNIHTHIVINSVRKYAVKRQSYMDKPNEEKAGYKHRSTNRFLNHLKKEVMEMCEREGFHQIDLLSPAPEKVTEAEFRAKAHGQKNWIGSIRKLCRKVFGRQQQHSRHRKIFSEIPLKNVPVPQELLNSSRVFFWRILTSPSFHKEGDTGISILTVTGELRKKPWERNMGGNIWRRFLSRMEKDYKRRKEHLRIIHQKRIITNIRLLFSIMAQNCVWLLICRQMSKPCRVKPMPEKSKSPICIRWQIP